MKVTVGFVGLDKVVKELETFEKNVNKSLDIVVKSAATEFVREAKRLLGRPYPEGAQDTKELSGSITYEKDAAHENTYIAGTNIQYAPYIEFGTRPHFPPLGDETKGLIRWAYLHLGAARGKTPVFGKVKKNDRLSKAKSIAYAVAKNISKRGTLPKPYMRPAFTKAKQQLLRDLEEKF